MLLCNSLVITSGIIVNNFVDNINSNTLLPWQLLIPPQTWHTRDVLNYISQNAESKETINELHTNVRISL